VNSSQHDWDAFISPDESYIIFSSQSREDTLGKQDLYISFRDTDNLWLPAINMGAKVNSADDEICPSFSLDGKYFFFTSRRRGLADIYWIDARIVEELRPR
jgi:Tol biopolymer transport system component